MPIPQAGPTEQAAGLLRPTLHTTLSFCQCDCSSSSTRLFAVLLRSPSPLPHPPLLLPPPTFTGQFRLQISRSRTGLDRPLLHSSPLSFSYSNIALILCTQLHLFSPQLAPPSSTHKVRRDANLLPAPAGWKEMPRLPRVLGSDADLRWSQQDIRRRPSPSFPSAISDSLFIFASPRP